MRIYQMKISLLFRSVIHVLLLWAKSAVFLFFMLMFQRKMGNITTVMLVCIRVTLLEKCDQAQCPVLQSRVHHLFLPRRYCVTRSQLQNTGQYPVLFSLHTEPRLHKHKQQCRYQRLCIDKTHDGSARDSGLHLCCNILIGLWVCMVMTMMLLEAFFPSLQRAKSLGWRPYSQEVCYINIKLKKNAQNSGNCQPQFVKPQLETV